MLVLTRLSKCHEFVDGSGCVFYHQQSGETIGLQCAVEKILDSSSNSEYEEVKRKLLSAGFVETINDE